MRNPTKRRKLLAAVALAGVAATLLAAPASAQPRPTPEPVEVFNPSGGEPDRIVTERIDPAVEAKTGAGEKIRVIIEIGGKRAEDRKPEIDQVTKSLPGAEALSDRHLVVTVDAAALRGILRNPNVIRVQEDTPRMAAMNDVNGIVGTNTLNTQGFNGNGRLVAVVDTGISHQQTWISNHIAAEACFSALGQCPGGVTGVAGGTVSEYAGDAHGTYVSGEMMARDPGYPGVARGARLVSIKGTDLVNGSHVIYTSAEIAAFNWLNTNTNAQGVFTFAGINQPLDVVNLSFNSSPVVGYCDNEVLKPYVDALLAKNVATTMSTGNNGSTSGVGAPACISTAVAVGATTKAGGVASFSNRGLALDFYAPGENITGPGPVANTIGTVSGTSMSSPIFGGMLASLQHKFPTYPKTQLLHALQRTGANLDARSRPDVSQVTADMLTKFTPVKPVRLLDSRNIGQTMNSGYWSVGNAMAALGTQPSQVKAIQLNITAITPTGAGYLNAWEGGQTAPGTSMLSVPANGTLPLSITTKTSPTTGQAWMNYIGGSTHVVVDLVGFWPSTSTYTPVYPARIGDTRYNVGGMGTFGHGANSVFNLTVAGVGGVPANATSVMLNITATGAGQTGFLAMYPAGAAWAGTSNVNFDPYETIANQVFVGVGSLGRVSIYNGGPAAVHVIVDVVGYQTTSSSMIPLAATRVFDSRYGQGQCIPGCAGKFNGPAGVRHVKIAGLGGVPVGARAAAVNLTGTAATTFSFAAGFQGTTYYPGTSNVNVVPGDSFPNLTWIGLDRNGYAALYGEGNTDLIVDVAGYSM